MQLDQILHICQRPGMYVNPGTLNGVCAFLAGLNAATGCLTGFREWLLPRFEDGNNLSWEGVVEKLLKSENLNGDDAATDRLGELISEFYEFTDSRRDLTRVFLRYHAWLLNRSWYCEGYPGYVAPYDGVVIPVTPASQTKCRTSK